MVNVLGDLGEGARWRRVLDGELPARELFDGFEATVDWPGSFYYDELLEAKLEGRQAPRGWGLFLIENMVDEARVTSEGSGHTVELALRLEGGGDGNG